MKNHQKPMGPGISKAQAHAFIVLALLLLASGGAYARPCCPEDPEDMTFQTLRDRSGYLIGNHVGDPVDFPFNLIFWSTRVNFYSYDGEFVIAGRSASGRLAGYSLDEYPKAAFYVYAKEDALNRIWHAPDMPKSAIGEIVGGNILIRFRKLPALG